MKLSKGNKKPNQHCFVLVILTCFLAGVLFILSNYLEKDCPIIPILDDTNTFAASAPAPASSAFELIPSKCDSPLRGQFDKIYETANWGAHLRKPNDFYGDAAWPMNDVVRMKSASGEGSGLGVATVTSLKIIKDTIIEYNVTSILDIPCGDVNWILDSFLTDTIPLYVGLDIVADVIKVDQQRFVHHNNKHFQFWDASECVLPKFKQQGQTQAQAFDLIHVRDVIQHLPLERGIKFVCNIFKSQAKVLVTTTYPDQKRNKNIGEGSWDKINLELEPFNFPHVESCTPTHPQVESDHTCVYNLTQPWVNDFLNLRC